MRTAFVIADELADASREIGCPSRSRHWDRLYWQKEVRNLLAAYLCLAGIDWACGRPHRVTMRTVEGWVTNQVRVDDATIDDLVTLGCAGGHELVRMADYARSRLLPLDGRDRATAAIYRNASEALGLRVTR